MSIQLNDLKKITKKFLNVIEENRIFSLLDVEQGSEKMFPIAGNPNEYISFEFRPSSDHRIAHRKSPTITYNKINGGMPIEVIINRYEDYSRIIVKTIDTIPGYSPFYVDIYGNIAQEKKIHSTNTSQVKKELENLLNIV